MSKRAKPKRDYFALLFGGFLIVVALYAAYTYGHSFGFRDGMCASGRSMMADCDKPKRAK